MNLYGNNLFFALLFVLLSVLQLILLRFHPVAAVRGKRQINKKLLDAVFCICVAFAVASLFRLYPGNTRAPIQDSSAFLYIGERMTEGRQPYRDLFDHKGPILYLIQWAGLSLTPNSFTGVWLLEVLNILITAFFLEKLAELVTNYTIDAKLSVLAALGICGWMVWQGGNFTEEYALLWISSAAYICFRFLCHGTYRTPDIILLGAGFSVVLLLRANMIAAWASLVPIILILLIREKRIKEIGRCFLLFVTGAALVILPVILWAAKAGFLQEMWQDYILFNFRYTEEAGGMGSRLLLSVRFMCVLWPAAAAILVSLILCPRNRLLWYNLLFFALSAFTAAMSGRLYYHYAIVMLPATVIPFSVCYSTLGGIIQREEKKREPDSILVLAVFCLMVMAALGYRQISSYVLSDDSVTAYLKKNTEEQDDVLIIGNSSWYYLLADRKTENRFFYQLPPMEISGELRDEFYEELHLHPPDCVVLPGYEEDRNWMNEAVGDIRAYLQNEYRHETYNEFEIYIK